MTTKTYYDLLGVNKTANTHEIKHAYRKLARALHPDVNRSHDADTRFKQLNEAYQTLIHPTRRTAYDQMLLAAANRAAQPPLHANRNQSGGPIAGATGEYFSWNATYYSAWMRGESPAQAAQTAPPPPQNVTLMDVMFRYGQRPIPWVILTVLALSVGAVWWWEGTPAGRNGMLILVLGCIAGMLLLFARELGRYRYVLKGRWIWVMERGVVALGMGSTLIALIIGGMTLAMLLAPFKAVVQVVGAMIPSFLAARWVINTGRKWKDRVDTESPNQKERQY